MVLKSADVTDFDTPFDNDEELTPRQRAILRSRWGPEGLGPNPSPIKLAWAPVRQLRERIGVIRRWMRKKSRGNDYLERLLAEIDPQLYAVELLVHDLEPVRCCEGVPRGGAANCPVCLGQRITTRTKRQQAFGR